MRRYSGISPNGKITGGDYTTEELEAAQAVGYVRSDNVSGLYDELDAYRKICPPGFQLVLGDPCDLSNVKERPGAILMGFLRVRQADPHYPVWLERRGPGRPMENGQRVEGKTIALPRWAWDVLEAQRDARGLRSINALLVELARDMPDTKRSD